MIKIDARGKQCPIPIVMVKKAIKEWKESDGMLQVLVDNEIAVQNLSKMANQLHYPLTSKQLEKHVYQVLFTINKDLVKPTEYQNAIKSQRHSPKQLSPIDFSIVVVSSETMGSGEKELGKILMKGFFYALTQMDTLPQSILFYNGGAKLTCESSECLEDIRNLEQEGVEILTCGTCLDFYNLKNSLQVGITTNMYEILEKQSQASKIIHP